MIAAIAAQKQETTVFLKRSRIKSKGIKAAIKQIAAIQNDFNGINVNINKETAKVPSTQAK
jgi:hypothetical protein